MLDVHPPHHSANTWRDFLLHIATIVVGLLIAIGLEQTVELVHHRHERQQLLEDIRGEGASNVRVCTNTVAFFKAADEVYSAMADAVRTAPAAGTRVTIVIPPLVRQREAVFAQVAAKRSGAFYPTIPAWETARDTQAAALLTPESKRFFAYLPYLLQWIDFYARNLNDARATYASLIRTLTGQHSPMIAPAQNALTVTPEQRDRLLDALSRMQDATDTLASQLQFFESRSHAVADGVQGDEEFKQWSTRHSQH